MSDEDRNAVIEECAKALDSKAALYRAYADRAGNDFSRRMMDEHWATTADDAKTVRALKSPSN